MKNEIKCLTGLRGVAAVIVMLYHFCGTDSYLRPYLPNLISRGYLGVDVFFVLSGFVMALTYAALFKDGSAGVDYKVFMVKLPGRVLHRPAELSCRDDARRAHPALVVHCSIRRRRRLAAGGACRSYCFGPVRAVPSARHHAVLRTGACEAHVRKPLRASSRIG